MARKVEQFEDMQRDYDWPDDLQALYTCAGLAWRIWAELDDALSEAYRLEAAGKGDLAAREQLVELAGQAHALLENHRAAGVKRLAEWNAAQAQAAEDDPAAVLHRIADAEPAVAALFEPVYSLSGDPAVHDMLAHPEEYSDTPADEAYERRLQAMTAKLVGQGYPPERAAELAVWELHVRDGGD